MRNFITARDFALVGTNVSELWVMNFLSEQIVLISASQISRPLTTVAARAAFNSYRWGEALLAALLITGACCRRDQSGVIRDGWLQGTFSLVFGPTDSPVTAFCGGVSVDNLLVPPPPIQLVQFPDAHLSKAEFIFANQPACCTPAP